jgi:hypothetical protein
MTLSRKKFCLLPSANKGSRADIVQATLCAKMQGMVSTICYGKRK